MSAHNDYSSNTYFKIKQTMLFSNMTKIPIFINEYITKMQNDEVHYN